MAIYLVAGAFFVIGFVAITVGSRPKADRDLITLGLVWMGSAAILAVLPSTPIW